MQKLTNVAKPHGLVSLSDEIFNRLSQHRTRKPSWRNGYARQQCMYEGPYGRNLRSDPRTKHHVDRQTGCEVFFGHFCISKMAVSGHLGFDWTGNSAIRSADSENPGLEPNMEWIGCTVCEIFAFKLYCDLETGVRVTQVHRKWHYSIEHIRLYIRLL